MGQIKVNNKIYETFIDKNNVTRFLPNQLILSLHNIVKTSQIIKLWEGNKISIIDVLDFYAGIGFPIEMVKELSFFEELVFEEIPNEQTK